MISIKNLTVRRGKRVIVSAFNAEISAGSITAITGPNGCGKSTLLAALAGDLAYEVGSVTFSGREVETLSLIEQAALRSVVMQTRNYWLAFTAREVIAMGQDAPALSRIDQVMKDLEITPFADQAATTLSGGQGQRVDIARALVRDSAIYLLDEPLSAQDSTSKARTIEVLKKMRDNGKTIVVIAHIEESGLAWCDQVIDFL
jgi:ABC-type cobalamin/Fe3+-siderophores transport system ATPase subunit